MREVFAYASSAVVTMSGALCCVVSPRWAQKLQVHLIYQVALKPRSYSRRKPYQADQGGLCIYFRYAWKLLLKATAVVLSHMIYVIL